MTNRSTLLAILLSCLVVFTRLSAFAAEAPLDDRHLAPLGAGDTIAVQVYGQPDMNTTVYVGDQGDVSVPLVGSVSIKGLSAVQAARKIEQALKDGQYLVDPHVTVSVVQTRSQRISVLGEVRNPSIYPLDPQSSVFELVAQAGGLTEAASDTAFVVRTQNDHQVRFPVATRASAVGAGTGYPPVTLQSGDTIDVPRADQFYIYGEVTNSNMYRIEPNMTVIQAIARAGGITPRGSERRVDIKRSDQAGNASIVHAKPNDLVKANDVIRVKESIF